MLGAKIRLRSFGPKLLEELAQKFTKNQSIWSQITYFSSLHNYLSKVPKIYLDLIKTTIFEDEKGYLSAFKKGKSN